MEGYWWCPKCHIEVEDRRVTAQELHEDCGHAVKWIEPVWVEPMRPRTLTDDEILSMTNKAKREKFLKTWKERPIWGELPELGLSVHRIELPNGKAIVAASYTGELCGQPWSSVHYQRLKPGEMLKPYHDISTTQCVDLLTGLRAEAKARQKAAKF